MSPNTLAPDEAAARRILLVQAFETEPAAGTGAAPVWTAHDRAWATRLARETTTAGATPEAFLDERARHALQRLQPHDADIPRALNARAWRWRWLLVAVALGAASGLLADTVGSSQHINLLAPPVWAVLAWNAVVYLALLLPQRRWSGLRGWLARQLGRWPGHAGGTLALARFQQLWWRAGAPLMTARAAVLMHAAALALALGLIGGLYLRGLVLDYRAGWQSTFLDAPQVHALLTTLLAPASRATGIAVPDLPTLQALRVAPGQAASGDGAPWIHLYAALLGLGVVLPRSALATGALLRSAGLARRLPLPVADLYFQRLLHERHGAAPRLQLLPHGGAPSADALAGLRILLAAALGDGLQLSVAAATAYGDEDQAAEPPPGTTQRLLLVEAGATPEDDTHGRWVQAVQATAPSLPLVLLVDESAFARRFVSMPARVVERRAAWQRWAGARQLPVVVLALAQPDLASAPAALNAALQG